MDGQAVAMSMPKKSIFRALSGAIVIANLALSASFTTSCSAADRPRSEQELIVPLSELSGLAMRTLPGGGLELLAVGDEERTIVALPIEAGVPNPDKARRISLPMPVVAGGSQLEGISVDSEGHVWVLAEPGEVYVYELDGDQAKELWNKPIVFLPGHPLAASWEADPNTRAEGLALVGKRVFIVKQASPAALIELLVEPDRLVAGPSHTLADMKDASDLALVGDELFIIGARTARICAIAIPGEKGPGDKAGGTACRRTWRLPANLGKGKTQWEGLAFLPDGRAVVGVDRKKFDRPNIAVIPALR